MKKSISIILLASSLLFILLSCNDNDDNYVPEAYRKILSLKESGIKDYSMNANQSSITENILILRGGGEPHSESNMEMYIMSKEEACEAWGYELEQIELIPSDSYTFPEGTVLKLDAEESYRYIPITFYPSRIYNAIKENQEAQWVLPIVLHSLSDTINQSMNKLLMRIDVYSPLVTWKQDEIENIEIVYKEKELPITLQITYSENNTLDFEATQDDNIDLKTLVDNFNKVQGTNHELLPESSYDLHSFSFTADSKTATSKIILKRDGLTADQTYVLPLKLKLSTELIDITESVKYLVVTNPKYCFEDLDKSKWNIVYCNSEIAGWGQALNLIDGNNDTAWGSNWNYFQWYNIAEYDDLYFGGNVSLQDAQFGNVSATELHPNNYWTCIGRRTASQIQIVVDLGESITLGGVGFRKNNNELGDIALKAFEVNMSETFTFNPPYENLNNYNLLDDGNDWGESVIEGETPLYAGDFWYTLADMKTSVIKSGRYLKLHPLSTYHEGNPFCSSVHELFVKKLISVDGKSVTD